MPVRRPHPSEQWDPGAETPARPAASVIVIRESPEGPEVLLVQRTPKARFMGGAWVFPGGAVDQGETADQTARRELEEEAAIRLPQDAALITFSRWITPAGLKTRFDTWFFVVEAPAGARPRVDGAECVDARWTRPQQALDECAADRLQLVFPTIKHLEQLALFPSVAATIEAARTRDVTPVQPRVVDDGGRPTVLLPGEPGFDAADPRG